MINTDYSIVIPIYKNAMNISDLENRINEMFEDFKNINKTSEFIIVVDGSPDESHHLLEKSLHRLPTTTRIYKLEKNVGSALAIRFGVRNSFGRFIAVMSADLQEPESLYKQMFETLELSKSDLIFGNRVTRQDPIVTKCFSTLYWYGWSKVFGLKIPSGGFDVFAISKNGAKILDSYKDRSTALVASLLDLGLPYEVCSYQRQRRRIGKSSWTLSKKYRLVFDSVFGFTNLPLRIINIVGFFGCLVSLVMITLAIYGKISGRIQVPGFATIAIAIFFTNSMVLLALGIVSSYVWRIFENTNGRPIYRIKSTENEF
jgi:glycosyltransferase involved in cell wall biosynthesis